MVSPAHYLIPALNPAPLGVLLTASFLPPFPRDCVLLPVDLSLPWGFHPADECPLGTALLPALHAIICPLPLGHTQPHLPPALRGTSSVHAQVWHTHWPLDNRLQTTPTGARLTVRPFASPQVCL